MDSNQWKQLDKLLHAALERLPEERDAFLRQACAGDQRLEREARSLLNLEQQAEGFLERPAIEMAAQVAVWEQSDDFSAYYGAFRASEKGMAGFRRVRSSSSVICLFCELSLR